MNYQEIDFARVGQVAGLKPKELNQFVNGIRQGEEDLLLERETFTLLQTVLERTVLEATSIYEVPETDKDRPFAYVTPKPLTPLIRTAHPRAAVASNMFRRLMGVSVMSDAGFRSTVETNTPAGRVIALAAGRAFQHDADLFSTSDDPNFVQPPRMTMHFVDEAGQPVSVACLAEQEPSQTAGRLVFGSKATSMYEAVQAQHKRNISEGRGAEYIYQTITGTELLKYSF